MFLLLAACAPAISSAPPVSPLVARYRLMSAAQGRPVVATRVYRDVLSSSLASRCRMVPTDSEAFDARARSCGALNAAVIGVSRLYLERAATPAYLRATTLEGRVRWLDLESSEPCGY